MSPFLIISIIWVSFEIFLSRRSRSSVESGEQDKSSLQILWITLIISISLGIFIHQYNPGTIPVYQKTIHYIGLFLIILGLIIRWIAILKLREFFTVTVSIQEGHRIIDTGIYKYIRHPAYLGSLLSFLGLGLALLNWISVIIICIPIFAALSYRMYIEEIALVNQFGDAYTNYISHTKKLIPWIY